MLDEWLQATSSSTNETPRGDPAAIVRGVLNRLDNNGVELPHDVVYACVLLLHAARTDLDRLELGLMRAASEHGNSWSWIAETFGHRSKQAAHARASALHRRLEYRTLDEEETR